MQQLEGHSKNETSILVSQLPTKTVFEHNTGIINDKSTKAARGHWMIEMLVGPFVAHDDAARFRATWMDQARGILSKRRFGKTQANKLRGTHPKLRCFDKRLIPEHYNEYLIAHDMAAMCVSERRIHDLRRSMVSVEPPKSAGEKGRKAAHATARVC